MSFASSLTSVANRLLTKYGESINVTRDNITSYTVSTGDVVGTADTTYLGMGHPSDYSTSEIDGKIIQRGDIKLLFYSAATTPLVNDIFKLNGKAYTALSIKNIRAQGSNIIYEVQLRQ